MSTPVRPTPTLPPNCATVLVFLRHRFIPTRVNRNPICLLLSLALALGIGTCASRGDEESRLVDESLDPPTAFSPDFAEKPQPVEEGPPVLQSFGPVGPAARQPTGHERFQR